MTRIAAAGESTRMFPNLFRRRTEKAKTNPFSHFPFVSFFPLLLLSLSRFRLLLSPVHVSLTSLSRMQKKYFCVAHIYSYNEKFGKRRTFASAPISRKKRKVNSIDSQDEKNFCIWSIVPSLPFPHYGKLSHWCKKVIFSWFSTKKISFFAKWEDLGRQLEFQWRKKYSQMNFFFCFRFYFPISSPPSKWVSHKTFSNNFMCIQRFHLAFICKMHHGHSGKKIPLPNIHWCVLSSSPKKKTLFEKEVSFSSIKSEWFFPLVVRRFPAKKEWIGENLSFSFP